MTANFWSFAVRIWWKSCLEVQFKRNFRVIWGPPPWSREAKPLAKGSRYGRIYTRTGSFLPLPPRNAAPFKVGFWGFLPWENFWNSKCSSVHFITFSAIKWISDCCTCLQQFYIFSSKNLQTRVDLLLPSSPFCNFFGITFHKNGNLVTVSLLPFLTHSGPAMAPFDYSLQEWKIV